MMRHVFSFLWLFSFYPALAQNGLFIDNPYEGVIWSGKDAWERHKSNFHTHTKRSNGSLSPSKTIDKYSKNGYSVLAITDHNNNTWPWLNWNRDPVALGMVAIPGNEFSSGHHRNALFCEIDGDPGNNIQKTIDLVAKSGGLIFFNHPGRYSEKLSWYTGYFTANSILFGMEIFNQGDRYSKDRELWDDILTELMPNRPVWGISNDDMHSRNDLFRNYNVLLVKSLKENLVRDALLKGRFFACYEPKGSGLAKAPYLWAINVDASAGTITISTGKNVTIEWIGNGSTITKGASIILSKFFDKSKTARYVRARLINKFGETHTQPFGVRVSNLSHTL